MINFKTKNGTFNFRTAGILFHDNKVLIHRRINDDFYALPGGRVEILEDTETTIIREMEEELGVYVEIERLLWVCQSFFGSDDSKYHEICFYYLINCKDKESITKEDVFLVSEHDKTFEFKWVPIGEIQKEPFYPTFIKNRLGNLPTTIESIIDFEE
ncbi:NUDIX hydrolase [Clostridium tunisiense]|uniref:NUDIX hydrolase n=1 Tax=Clostridium tunisiense TaxID=219748 RepID=UPI0002EE2779|nr:NUDIX hydrolase [Clostridium tunisiense]